MLTEILTDLRDEYDRLDSILDGLSDDQWRAPSAAVGWSVCDVVVHLAHTESSVATTIDMADPSYTRWDGDMEDAIDVIVKEQATDPASALAWWREAVGSSLDALGRADPDQRYTWAAAPLRPAALATTRLAEHWAHALDITEALDIDLPDTDRLRHIAWLGHRTIPYGCEVAGIEAHPVRAELDAPSGDTWRFGPDDAASTIAGSAGVWCRVGAQRIRPEASGLRTSGPHADAMLGVLRNFAA